MTSLVYEVVICIEPHVDVSLCVLNYLESDIYPRRSFCFLWHLRGTAFASCYFCKHVALQVFFFSFFRLLEINPQRHAMAWYRYCVVSERFRVNVDVFLGGGVGSVSANITIKKRRLVVRSAGLQEAPEFTGRQASCIRAPHHPPVPSPRRLGSSRRDQS